jgi:hypothetical protein
VDHLAQVWGARTVATVPAERYVDFQVYRPQTRIDDDGRRVIDWPDTTVQILTPPHGPEIVLVHGPEPSLHWNEYCGAVLDALDAADVSRVVVLGALLADVPHSRPLPVSDMVEPGRHEKVPADSYEGPVGIPSVLAQAAVSRGLRTSSVWVQVPHYVSQDTSPKAVLALIRSLQDHVTASVPLGELEEEAAAWERGVDELSRNDPEIAQYVQGLEKAQDASELPEASGEAIAREFERYLRRRDDGNPPKGTGNVPPGSR